LNQVLEGKVTNVTAFGAFVDVGVHQDGLVHISAMSDQYIDDPRSVVRAGDIVKVKVMNIDVERKRIGMSMRLSDDAAEQLSEGKTPSRSRPSRPKPKQQTKTKQAGQKKPPADNRPSALALSLKAALNKN